mmetsp:Transcript_32697/g.81984  ORF Transcript_32697/g.81984 Transcript_32697/m.81984 type:complete len:122 (-) Transcript_32697:46-411(-)|eukprot:CAMPEP_0174236594 /NCGR_PEP_ID=MMETSP0417-20130205/5683_1 /TAXON_ID=242541 /ORGANISM="Mayorella sp, Strain BSH-02190019" /LENGTH=121 /DNA_ID=CAMNT_0015315263 /DNA_START=141 /DNA_END=506 /DNA_ORIENTATION=+
MTERVDISVPSSSARLTIPGREDGFSISPSDLSQSVGGTFYATTPGGTRIAYERSQLMFLRNSPLTKTPPTGLPFIPGVTSPSAGGFVKPVQQKAPSSIKSAKKSDEEPPADGGQMFQLEL